jgi:hypothetical protein
MTRQRLQAITLGLMLVSLPLISAGLSAEQTWLWGLGLALLAVAGLIPPLSRLATGEEEQEVG